MKLYKQLGLIMGYTIFYHGLYHCPKINKQFDKWIRILHGLKSK